MARYHVNDEGEAGQCSATVRCPFGDINADHYASADDARAAYEAGRPAIPLSRPSRSPDQELTWEDDEALARTLEGQRVIGVDLSSGIMKLSDGSMVEIIPNEGCGGCASGNYDLSSLERIDNIITSAKVETEDMGSYETRYSIFVYAQNEKIALATVEGSDGGGWNYGTGFSLRVWAGR